MLLQTIKTSWCQLCTSNVWTHALHSPIAGPPPGLISFLEYLKSIITLPMLPHLRASVALDWYKIPLEGVDPFQWPNSPLGQNVSRGKYWFKSDPRQQQIAGLEISGAICRTVASNPLFNLAEYVLDVPGHDGSQLSFGSRLAATVARDLGKKFLRARSTTEFRPAAKNLTAAQSNAAVSGKFRVDQPLTGKTVLIVDDVFRSGRSLSEVSRAASAAGVSTVYGVCAVRTMRR